LVTQIYDFAGAPHAKNWCIAFLEWLSNHAKDEITSWGSADEFLERRQDVANVGRLVISICLLLAEHKAESQLWSNAGGKHWYDYLKSQLTNPADKLGQDQFRIITFNYERSLEYFLYRSLKPFYKQVMTEETYTAAIKQFRFLHIYGNLGPLPWQSATGAVPYGAQGYGEILTAAKSIKVLHQGAEDTVQQNFKTAQEWLQWAERVLFLGFGFHKDNVERLAIYETLGQDGKDRDIRASCLGLDATNRDRVEWGRRAHVRPPVIQFAPPTEDCYKFLHDHVVLS
jgi:hypothetical protein